MLGYKLTSRKCIMDALKYDSEQDFFSDLENPKVCLGGPNFNSGFVWELNLREQADQQSKDPADYYVRVLYNG